MMMDKVENTLVDLMECLARCEGIEADTQQDILILMARLEGLEPRPQPDNKEGEGVEWEPGVDLPPVGVWVNLVNEDEHVEVMCHGKGTKFCGRDMDGYIGIFDAEFAEPIQSHRDKVIEAAYKAFPETPAHTKKVLGMAYDAGFLRLPNDKEGE